MTIEHNNPFVNTPAQGSDTTISAEDMLKLLDTLKIDTSDTELQALLLNAQNGQPVERDTLMTVVTNLLSNDTKHLGELNENIGDFEIEFR
ncbi:uncharacterized protein EV154DRAFT_326982 [Mucor mucedo]|uniref:uncharacterized protein n=1 Tax=Mucor mucedo TaxID=29922 RepID=UPI00221F857B|nr:uncharacterized protein EV154DRAFT_326982 [Mucor mucedo]KAI7887891.1 hypothetical protein EV154DRAFT_326982 [Mucor mucedo]